MFSEDADDNLELKLDKEEEKLLNLKIEGLEDKELKNMLKYQTMWNRKEVIQRTKITECCMVRHDSRFKRNFDIFIILMALYNCITLPLEVSFTTLYFIQ